MINNDSKKDYKSPDFKVFDVRPESIICLSETDKPGGTITPGEDNGDE